MNKLKSLIQWWQEVCYILCKGSTYKKYNELLATTVQLYRIVRLLGLVDSRSIKLFIDRIPLKTFYQLLPYMV